MISFDCKILYIYQEINFFHENYPKIGPGIVDFTFNQALIFACIAGGGEGAWKSWEEPQAG